MTTFKRKRVYIAKNNGYDPYAALVEQTPWLKRVQGVRTNTSWKSHGEFDEAEELDTRGPRPTESTNF